VFAEQNYRRTKIKSCPAEQWQNTACSRTSRVWCQVSTSHGRTAEQLYQIRPGQNDPHPHTRVQKLSSIKPNPADVSDCTMPTSLYLLCRDYIPKVLKQKFLWARCHSCRRTNRVDGWYWVSSLVTVHQHIKGHSLPQTFWVKANMKRKWKSSQK